MKDVDLENEEAVIAKVSEACMIAYHRNLKRSPANGGTGEEERGKSVAEVRQRQVCHTPSSIVVCMGPINSYTVRGSPQKPNMV